MRYFPRFASGDCYPPADAFDTFRRTPTPTPESEPTVAAIKSAATAAIDDARYHTPHTSDELTERNVDTVIRLEREVRERRTAGDRAIDSITAFC